MNYTYDAIIEKDKGGYAVTFPQFSEAVTFGKTPQEACKNAAEVLTLVLCLATCRKSRQVRTNMLGKN